MSFAKTYLSECWPTLAAADHTFVRTVAPELVGEIARSNPHYRSNVVAGLAKLTSFLADIGVIADRDRWLELGLVADDPQ